MLSRCVHFCWDTEDTEENTEATEEDELLCALRFEFRALCAEIEILSGCGFARWVLAGGIAN